MSLAALLVALALLLTPAAAAAAPAARPAEGPAARTDSGDWPFPDAGLDGESLRQIRAKAAPRWFNARPLFTVAQDPEGRTGIVSLDRSLRGKTVLIHFWDYTNAHALDLVPVLSAWQSRYGKDGLVIVAVQAPQFPFGADPRNVAREVRRLGITYPVYLDADFLVWRLFENRHWPRSILVAPGGKVVDDTVGSSDTQGTETAIRLIFGKRSGKIYREPLLPPLPPERPGLVCHHETPDLPCGSENGRLGSPGYAEGGAVTEYSIPAHAEVRQDGVIYLGGAWRATREALFPAATGGWKMRLRFAAVGLALVAAPPPDGAAPVTVTLDGAPVPPRLRGADLRAAPDGATTLAVDAPRRYRVLAGVPFGKHEIVLSPKRAGTGFYVFYFDGCDKGDRPAGK